MNIYITEVVRTASNQTRYKISLHHNSLVNPTCRISISLLVWFGNIWSQVVELSSYTLPPFPQHRVRGQAYRSDGKYRDEFSPIITGLSLNGEAMAEATALQGCPRCWGRARSTDGRPRWGGNAGVFSSAVMAGCSVSNLKVKGS